MTDAALIPGGHWNALLEALPTDTSEVTDEHIRLVLAALEGEERLLRQQRDDVSLVAWATACRTPDVVHKIIAACEDERGTLAIGRSRVTAWAWRVAWNSHPQLHALLKALGE
jgi:hypothetical protein